MQTLIIHGRQPGLARAELESLYGARALRPVGANATTLDINPADINFSRLGGMVKFCKILTVLDTDDWHKIERFLVEVSPGHASSMEPGKLTIGLSAYGLKVSPRRMLATGLTLKKAIKAAGRPVRLVPNKQIELNAAQVLYNKLTQKLGWELVFVRDGKQTMIAQSIAVQDIESYAARDQARPKRDARVGMLPPKLAQIIINLAAGKNRIRNVFDPFCGTGVMLQEALLMGYDAIGSDMDPRMVEYSEENLAWLTKKGRTICPGGVEPSKNYTLSVADATKVKLGQADCIASEIFLGRPLSAVPDGATLQKIANDCDTITAKFLANIAGQTKPGFRMCIAVPAWKTKNGFKRLPTLDNLDKLGYNSVSFVHAADNELIYHREGQLVARELIAIERK